MFDISLLKIIKGDVKVELVGGFLLWKAEMIGQSELRCWDFKGADIQVDCWM